MRDACDAAISSTGTHFLPSLRVSHDTPLFSSAAASYRSDIGESRKTIRSAPESLSRVKASSNPSDDRTSVQASNSTPSSRAASTAARQHLSYNGIASNVSILSLSSTTIRSLNRNGIHEMSILSR
jgi:hypothetical protein